LIGELAGGMTRIEQAKREAGRAALGEVQSGMRLGLGTGSTVRYFLEALGEALREGALSDLRGVPTSLDTERRCIDLGIPLLTLAEAGTLDLAVDGADEVTPALDLVKGLGGALLREKIVVQAARRFVVIADRAKAVDRLGTRAPLPVEVAAFEWSCHLPFFRELGAEPVLREDREGSPCVTDNGNLLVDLHFSSGISDPFELERSLQRRAGVVECGLFLGLADRALLASESGEIMVLDRMSGRGF